MALIVEGAVCLQTSNSQETLFTQNATACETRQKLNKINQKSDIIDTNKMGKEIGNPGSCIS